jgi:GNAT superfamily N-acetyltransferase
MIVTYAVEHLRDMKPELENLLPRHWMEIARDQEIIKLDPDWDSYFAMENMGQFHGMVARCEGKMIGYHISFIRPHLHYRKSLSAIVDIYFILPEYRKGRVGVELFKEVEKSWKARGVQKAFTGTKVFHDMSKLFERLGWRFTEKLYTKVL